MVSTSKVLTVSYGTFSCTLEGFDDSFDTMKAIAEYFRDLASEDRYFGAEPPTPDAEMLARIAEREVARRVEAHSEDGNIVLRTALPAAAAVVNPDQTIEPNNDDAAQSEADQTTEEASDLQAPNAGEAEKALADAEERRLEEERVAAQLLAQQQAEAEAEAEALAAKLAAEQAENDAKLEAERAALSAAEEKAQAVAEQDAEAEAKIEDIAETLPSDAKSSDANGDSIADKLARIRAVVGQPADVPQRSDFSEDEHADDIMQGTPGDTDLEDILDLSEEDLKPSADSEIAISGITAQASEDELKDDPLELTEAVSTSIEAPAESSADETPVTPKRPVRARVIKMKRAEFEAAVASGELEEDTDEQFPESAIDDAVIVDAAPQQNESDLSADEEAELQRELAAVEAELAGMEIEAPTTAFDENGEHPIPDYEEVAPVQTQPSRGADDLEQTPDAEMDRLLVQTNTELDEPDGKKRRNALGHLRAAVASARADKEHGFGDDTVDGTVAYRDDLEDAVRPSRPVRRLKVENAQPSGETVRPPLKLVAEQRVDTPQAQEDVSSPQPVRPRRMRTEDPRPVAEAVEIDGEGGTFLEFAEEMGATELPDLLEAAAAYLAYVEGREQFSRPQLMTKVRMVQEENFSREDGLRTFGQLLRQGKIEKISGGRFTVSDRISFKPDTRAAG